MSNPLMDMRPTKEDIDSLVAFLPRLYGPSAKITEEGESLGLPDDPGVIELAPPDYPPSIREFFGLAAGPVWNDRDYVRNGAAEMLDDLDSVSLASLDQIKSMLTFCVRGERFCYGHWESAICSGRIKALLERLLALRG